MKIQALHYDYMKDAISKVDIHKARLDILNSDKQPNDFDKRLRWDCMYIANLSQWTCDNLYSYMDDSHIDTALKSIFKELQQ